MKIEIDTKFRPEDIVYFFELQDKKIIKDVIRDISISVKCNDRNLNHAVPEYSWIIAYTLVGTGGVFQEENLFQTLEKCKDGIVQSFRIIE